jgi:hypothetical protein
LLPSAKNTTGAAKFSARATPVCRLHVPSYEENWEMTRTFWTGWGATLLAGLLLTGCTEESTPGGPGAETVPAETGDTGFPENGYGADNGSLTDDTPDPGEPVNEEATFTLGMPTGATNIEQGKSQAVTISIDRGDEFTGDVNVALTPQPGITVDPQQFTFRSDQDEMEVQVTAGPTATLGEQIIQVEGQGASGPPAKGQLMIEVTKADTDDTPEANPNQDNLNPAAPPANPANPEAGAPPADDNP